MLVVSLRSPRILNRENVHCFSVSHETQILGRHDRLTFGARSNTYRTNHPKQRGEPLRYHEFLKLNFITLLTLGRFLAAEFGLDEDVDLSVHDFLNIAGLGAGAVVFDHLIWLKNVGTDLVAPRDLAFLAILPVDLGAFFVLLDLVNFRF